MTECTSISIEVHPDDLNHPAWLKYIDEHGESQYDILPSDIPPNHWEDEAANFGNHEANVALAKAGVRFFGGHGSRDGVFGAYEFFSDGGDGELHEAPEDTWSCGLVMVQTIEIDGQRGIKPLDAQKQLRLLERYWKIVKEIDDRAKEAYPEKEAAA